jgi:sarcosine oxidase/L-pipecolate oxidase
VDLRVEYVSATVSTLAFDENKSCAGVRLSTGELLQADHIVLCTRAHTALLLADSAPERKEMQVDGRMVAAAACMGLFKVPKDQMSKFQETPAIIAPEAEYPGEQKMIPPRD